MSNVAVGSYISPQGTYDTYTQGSNDPIIVMGRGQDDLAVRCYIDEILVHRLPMAEKMMAKMFAEPDLDTMQRVRCAFDPLLLSNPTKVFPTPRLCGEKPGEFQPHPLESAGIAERF